MLAAVTGKAGDGSRVVRRNVQAAVATLNGLLLRCNEVAEVLSSPRVGGFGRTRAGIDA